MKKFFTLTLLVGIASNLHAQLVIGDSIPVRISYINGQRSGNSNQLNWAVTCFLQYANFEVQRSENGLSYSTIHTFQADELRCRQPFTYTDLQPTEKSFYRIRAGDLDGKFYSSKIVGLYGTAKGFDITSITPTIVADKAVLNISSSSPGKVEIIITSVSGVVTTKVFSTLQKGDNSVLLETNNLLKGSYIISVTNPQGEIRSRTIIKN
ncbi:MAG: hypothetical protein SGI83_02380 [Bacteroidota bacterium]|nr:hypothetical protein [Bacteroidota bacterium]